MCAAAYALFAVPIIKSPTDIMATEIERTLEESEIAEDAKDKIEFYLRIINYNQRLTIDCWYRVRTLSIFGFFACAMAFWTLGVYLWRSKKIGYGCFAAVALAVVAIIVALFYFAP